MRLRQCGLDRVAVGTEVFPHVRSDAFATALGKTLESYLTTQNVFARAMQQYLEQALRGLNIISAADAEICARSRVIPIAIRRKRNILPKNLLSPN